MNILNYQFKSIDIEVSGKTAIKVSSILLSIPRHESIADTDTTKVSSIVSMSISIFDINNPDVYCNSLYTNMPLMSETSD